MNDVTAAPGLALDSLLPLRVLVVTLQAIDESRPAFFHQAALMAFLRFLAKSPEYFDHFIRIDALESGRIHYRAGDFYRFMLIGLADSDAMLDTILLALSKLPYSAPKKDHSLPFRDNWRLHSVQDAFSELPVQQLSQASLYAIEQLQEEAQLWQQEQAVTWRWLTPARLLKSKEKREGVRENARYCRDLQDLPASLLFCRLHDSIADLLRRRGSKSVPRQAPPAVNMNQGHLFWLDAEYRDDQGKSTVMGGVSGHLQLGFVEPLPIEWWQRMILGQYLGMGQTTAFGWGRYQLMTNQGLCSYRRAFPASSLLNQVQREENLASAWRHVMRSIDESLATHLSEDDEAEDNAIDDALYNTVDAILEFDDEPPQAPLERLARDIQQITAGAYKAPLLRGHIITQAGGKLRPLAIPPAYDRVLQRAVAQVLTPALEQLMYRHSHGYRRGRSRITARYDIQAAWRAGYRWVYESDIEDFFDSVSLQHLSSRLRAIYGDDPIVGAVIAWMKADVKYKNEVIQRHNGLPQGSPLSPLMANLILDDFDSDLEAAGFHLIRFADDFIILCKDPSTAVAAGAAARASLAEHGLRLNEHKTHITAMDDGFNYLGYLFVNDLALDVSGSDKSASTLVSTAPPNSWLAQLGERQATQIKEEKSLTQLEQRLLHAQSITLGEREENGTLLTITGDPSVLSTLNENLQVTRKDQLVHRAPWRSLQAVIVFGNHQITTQAMRAAMRHTVPIHLSNASGMYHGVISSNQSTQGESLWLQQIHCVKDEDKALYCAREIVKARLIHIKETLRQRQQAHNLSAIDQAIRTLNQSENLASLRGQEGAATREYYQRIAQIIPPEFNFNGRNRRPPRDPFNVLLSLGFTILYGYTQSIIHATGLLPRQGFYHQARGQHAALASDLMEPFRHIIERGAMSAILRHEITCADFSHSPAGACLISAAARRKYLALLLSQWEQTVKARGDENSQTYFTHMYQQALSFKAFIREGSAFRAWRMR